MPAFPGGTDRDDAGMPQEAHSKESAEKTAAVMAAGCLLLFDCPFLTVLLNMVICSSGGVSVSRARNLLSSLIIKQ